MWGRRRRLARVAGGVAQRRVPNQNRRVPYFRGVLHPPLCRDTPPRVVSLVFRTVTLLPGCFQSVQPAADLDTSSVTTMPGMFSVRALDPTSSRALRLPLV